MAAVVHDFRFRAGQDVTVRGLVELIHSSYFFCAKSTRSKPGIGDLEHRSGRAQVAGLLQKRLRLLDLLGREGGPAAARRGRGLGAVSGQQRDRLFPKRDGVGRFTLRIVQFGQGLRGVSPELPGRLRIDQPCKSARPAASLCVARNARPSRYCASSFSTPSP